MILELSFSSLIHYIYAISQGEKEDEKIVLQRLLNPDYSDLLMCGLSVTSTTDSTGGDANEHPIHFYPSANQ